MKRNDMAAKITAIFRLDGERFDLKALKVLELLEDEGMVDPRKWDKEDPEITLKRSDFLRMASESLKEEFSSSRALMHSGPVTHNDVIGILSKKIFGDIT